MPLAPRPRPTRRTHLDRAPLLLTTQPINRQWNLFGRDVSQALMTSIMDAMVNRSRTVNGVPTSLFDLGYSDVGLDVRPPATRAQRTPCSLFHLTPPRRRTRGKRWTRGRGGRATTTLTATRS